MRTEKERVLQIDTSYFLISVIKRIDLLERKLLVEPQVEKLRKELKKLMKVKRQLLKEMEK